MKIVTINGSPRKNGCSAKLLSCIAEGAQKNGASIVDFHVNSMDIKGCQACMACKQVNKCVIDDDMNSIYEEVNDADVLVIGAPIYHHEMSAQLKLVVDRFYSYMHMDEQYRFSSTLKKGKRCIIVFPYGNPDVEVYREYVKLVENLFLHFGFEEVQSFIASNSMPSIPEYSIQCEEIGQSL